MSDAANSETETLVPRTREADEMPGALLDDQPRFDASFMKAQSEARKWADRAIELTQAGRVDQAVCAERQAELWLRKMAAIESQVSEPPAIGASQPTRGPNGSARQLRRRSHTMPSGTSTNNAALLAWVR